MLPRRRYAPETLGGNVFLASEHKVVMTDDDEKARNIGRRSSVPFLTQLRLRCLIHSLQSDSPFDSGARRLSRFELAPTTGGAPSGDAGQRGCHHRSPGRQSHVRTAAWSSSRLCNALLNNIMRSALLLTSWMLPVWSIAAVGPVHSVQPRWR